MYSALDSSTFVPSWNANKARSQEEFEYDIERQEQAHYEILQEIHRFEARSEIITNLFVKRGNAQLLFAPASRTRQSPRNIQVSQEICEAGATDSGVSKENCRAGDCQ